VSGAPTGSQAKHLDRIKALGWHRGSFENEERLSSYVLADVRDVLAADSAELIAAASKLPKKHDTGIFEGREKELAALDSLWVDVLANKPGRAQIVSLVAIGGAGKTTIASRWKDTLLARAHHGGVERYFDWSFYSQGTRRDGEADATVLVAEALKFFGDPAMADSAAPARDKGAHLAMLATKQRTLLILDGLEPLQYPPGPQNGELKDDALRALFAGLMNGHGLCVVTTREPIADLASTRESTTPEWKLDHLDDAASALVLKRHGVTGPEEELRCASAEVKGHALTLTLMGQYLNLAFIPPDIARRDCFRFSEADAETENGHAFRVFAEYERWFERAGRQAELAILRLLGLFDRPATPDCIGALCAEPAIPGLTEPLIGLGEKRWNAAIKRLCDLDLIETAVWVPMNASGYDEKAARAAMAAGVQGFTTNLGPPQAFARDLSSLVMNRSLDAHPLLREYFAVRLKERGIASTAHSQLYDYLCSSVPFWPEGREGLLPLYQAVSHGCKAGRYEEARARVYRDRIQRGTRGSTSFYSTHKLGLLSLNLAAIACFFVDPWRTLSSDLTLNDQAWLLNEAAFTLRGLNRLAEARDPLRTGLETSVADKQWSDAAISAGSLSELELDLGNLPASEEMAKQAVKFADESSDKFAKMGYRTTHADALHKLGRLNESHSVFRAAESIQAERQSKYPLLYALQGYRYCDLLLDPAERVAWQAYTAPRAAGADEAVLSNLAALRNRAVQMFNWREAGDSLLCIALDHLTLGRVYLLCAVLQGAELRQAHSPLESAVATLRRASSSDDLSRALLPSAWLHALLGEWDLAHQRLDESYTLAARAGNPQKNWEGGMRLYLIDTLLHRARLFFKRPEYPWPGRTPRMDLEEAARLIDICGYHRRDAELTDAMAVIT
jgi:hypothetical protein